jgi:hypothetical protein
MIAQYVAIVALVIAVILQVAVSRAPDLQKSLTKRAARRVLIVGLALSALCFVTLSMNGVTVNSVALLGVTMVAMAEIFFCTAALFPHATEAHGEAEKP